MVKYKIENMGSAHPLFNHNAEAPEYTQCVIWEDDVPIIFTVGPKAKIYANAILTKLKGG